MTLTDGFVGGGFIGLAAAILLLFSGEILGSSGIINGFVLQPTRVFRDPSQYWKLTFLLSFAAACYWYLGDTRLKIVAQAQDRFDGAYWAAGLLVGLGTKLGNGCTSGHGICGLGRQSLRSFTAVMTFMTSALATTYAIRATFLGDYVLASTPVPPSPAELQMGQYVATGFLAILATAALVTPLWYWKRHTDAARAEEAQQDKEQAAAGVAKVDDHPHHWYDPIAKILPGLVSGSLFVGGLYCSGMMYPANVIGFLDVGRLWAQDESSLSWDPSLLAVMGSGVLVSFLSYECVEGFQTLCHACWTPLSSPVALQSGSPFGGVPTNKKLDLHLTSGAFCFGVGWALVGVCPAPGLIAAALGVPQIVFQWWPAYIVGVHIAQEIKQRV